MTRANDKGLIVATAMLLLASAACLQVKYPEPGQPVAVAEGESLAFGRIEVIDRGHEILPWRFGLREALFAGEKPEIKLSLFLVESNRRAVSVRIEPDGSFFWIVPSGTYLLYQSRIDEQPPNEPLVAFQIAPGEHSVYLGTMTMYIESHYDRDRGKQDYELRAVEISDEFERAKQALAGSHPDLAGSSERNLMITDPLLQGLFRNYSQRACEKILEPHGLKLLRSGITPKN